ncbi:non-ribosomal peptide synthetase, partial [Archangium sp.]|uniref:non-ribosomal peptide synthetase n=1 Tax=Archangium sp. TaxID=1872627 RepID=UPI002D549B4C
MKQNKQGPMHAEQASGSSFVPCSLLQEHFWNLEQRMAGSGSLCVQGGFRISGRLELSALERGLDELIRRHHILRTRFSLIEGAPAQIVEEARHLALTVLELSQAGEGERRAAAEEHARRPFDPSRGPLLHATLLRLGSQEHVLLLGMHRLIADEACFGVLGRELTALYGVFSAGRTPRLPEPSQYAEFAREQRSRLRGETLDLHLGFWKQQLAGATPAQLPTDLPASLGRSGARARHPFVLPHALVEALRALEAGEADSLRVTLLAAFRLLLHRHAHQQEDISVGLLLPHEAGRSELLGPVASPLVLRTPLMGNPTFHSLRSAVRGTLTEALAHRALPFEALLDALRPGREPGPALLQALVIFETPTSELLLLPELSFVPLDTEGGVAPCDLTLRLSEGPDELRGALEYNAELFRAATIARMVERFQRLLEGIAATPGRRVSELPLLPRQEQHLLIEEWNDARLPVTPDVCAHQLFEEQVQRTPDAVAVTFEGAQLTYAELERRANQLAHHLRSLGVGLETRVGLCVERSLEMVVGIFGILKAGGAYVPLDPAVPAERLGFMMADSGLPVLLTQERLVSGLPEHGAQVVRLDSDWERIARRSTEPPASGSSSASLAYVIYTSGSTGKPKGTLLAHRGLCNTARAAIEALAIRPDSRVLQFSSLGFDASVWEIFSTLLAGARLVLGSREALLPGAPLQTLLKEQAVTTATLTPSVLTQLEAASLLPTLETVAAAGEACTPELV